MGTSLAGRFRLGLVADHPPARSRIPLRRLAIVDIETLFVSRYVNMKPKDVVKAFRT